MFVLIIEKYYSRIPTILRTRGADYDLKTAPAKLELLQRH